MYSLFLFNRSNRLNNFGGYKVKLVPDSLGLNIISFTSTLPWYEYVRILYKLFCFFNSSKGIMNSISGSSIVLPDINFSILKYLLSYGSGKNSLNRTNCLIYT